jgi:hypothetical protein
MKKIDRQKQSLALDKLFFIKQSAGFSTRNLALMLGISSMKVCLILNGKSAIKIINYNFIDFYYDLIKKYDDNFIEHMGSRSIYDVTACLERKKLALKMIATLKKSKKITDIEKRFLRGEK